MKFVKIPAGYAGAETDYGREILKKFTDRPA
jgi:hypothetical protein